MVDAVCDRGGVTLRPVVQFLRDRAGVDRDGDRVRRHHVAQDALCQAGFYIDGRGRRCLADPGLDIGPESVQIGNVGGQLFITGIFGLGAYDETAWVVVGFQCDQPFPQCCPFGLIADALRNPDMGLVRQIDQHAPCDADMGGQSCALGSQWILDHLDQQRLTLEQQFFDGGLQ